MVSVDAQSDGDLQQRKNHMSFAVILFRCGNTAELKVV